MSHVPQYNMNASAQARPAAIRKRITSVTDKRFLGFQRNLLADLQKTNGRGLNIRLWIQLACWGQAGGSFRLVAQVMKTLSKEWFGYVIPGKIGKVVLQEYRYRSIEAIAEISPPLIAYHKSHVK